MVTAFVTSDGSCLQGEAAERRGLARNGAGPGGWCAIVEFGSEGWVVRGHETETKSQAMETLAALEGLRSLPDGTPVHLETDSQHVEQNLRRAAAGFQGGADHRFNVEVARLGPVTVKRVRDTYGSPLRRAHLIAREEANRAAKLVWAEAPARARERRKRRVETQGVIVLPARSGIPRVAWVPPVHRRGCDPVQGCVTGCPYVRLGLAPAR